MKAVFLEPKSSFRNDLRSDTMWGLIISSLSLLHDESYIDKITSQHLRDFYSEIISNNYSIIDITSFQFYNTKFEIGIRRSGFLRPMIANLSPLTIIIPTFEEMKTQKITVKT